MPGCGHHRRAVVEQGLGGDHHGAGRQHRQHQSGPGPQGVAEAQHQHRAADEPERSHGGDQAARLRFGGVPDRVQAGQRQAGQGQHGGDHIDDATGRGAVDDGVPLSTNNVNRGGFPTGGVQLFRVAGDGAQQQHRGQGDHHDEGGAGGPVSGLGQQHPDPDRGGQSGADRVDGERDRGQPAGVQHDRGTDPEDQEQRQQYRPERGEPGRHRHRPDDQSRDQQSQAQGGDQQPLSGAHRPAAAGADRRRQGDPAPAPPRQSAAEPWLGLCGGPVVLRRSRGGAGGRGPDRRLLVGSLLGGESRREDPRAAQGGRLHGVLSGSSR